MTVIEKLQKSLEVLESNHVGTVEVGFEHSMDGIRFYSAVTYKNGEQHKYRVRVQDWFENGEKQVWAKCSCKASGQSLACRHILRVAEIDAETFNRDIYLDTFIGYKTYQCYAKRAVA